MRKDETLPMQTKRKMLIRVVSLNTGREDGDSGKIARVCRYVNNEEQHVTAHHAICCQWRLKHVCCLIGRHLWVCDFRQEKKIKSTVRGRREDDMWKCERNWNLNAKVVAKIGERERKEERKRDNIRVSKWKGKRKTEESKKEKGKRGKKKESERERVKGKEEKSEQRESGKEWGKEIKVR